MLSWFDADPSRYSFAALLVCIGVGFIAVRSILQRADSSGSKRFDWVWICAILLLLLAGRWPGFFVPHEYNVDESQLIAGALTLRHDPVFWRSVDCGTAGPLDVFALLPAGWLTGEDTYVSARVTALLLIWGSLLLAYQSIAAQFGRVVARISTLPAAAFEAFTLHPDFLHYSTELVPMFLLSLAFYLALQRLRSPEQVRSWIGALAVGAVLGTVPFSKLQAGPIAAAVGLLLVAQEARRMRRNEPGSKIAMAALIAGACAPLGLIALQLTITSEWENAIIPYFLSNIGYLHHGLRSATALLLGFGENLSQPGSLFTSFLAGNLVLLLLSLAWCRTKARPFHSDSSAIASITFLVASVFCVLAPHRPAIHYLQFVIVPMTVVAGAGLGFALSTMAVGRRKAALGVAIMVPLGMVAWFQADAAHPNAETLRTSRKAPMDYVSWVIRHYGKSGEPLGFWGWTSQYYVDTGMWQATRDAVSFAEIIDNNQTAYYHQRYLADLKRNSPPVFVDASESPEGMPATVRHEILFPALGSFVRTHYTWVQTVNKIRIYARNDRLPPKSATTAASQP